ncbi:MAG TPA: gliding motility-associated protein GldE [Chitinophaga sp.]|uniref:gliding motility-associated protein GldE n=1 Tax=Chitinophaga sp. TaxID=1869181 RepID=UPI002DB5FDB3|nr:gliding motility-associated protein GldE [Chitinophaga sp.]HEU4556108.1 gliding motility-associated protein GldE [Chitinophaga sp.]
MQFYLASIFSGTPLLLQAKPPVATPNAVIYLLVIFILLLLAFIVSGAEVAFFTLNYKDLNVLKTRQNTSGKLITKLLEKPKSLLASLQIAGVLLAIAFIMVTNYLITQMEDLQTLPVISLVVRVAVICFILLFFGQVLPRVWAAQNNIRFATYFAWFVSIIHATLEPVSDFFVELSASIEGRFFHRLSGGAVNYQEIDEAIELSVDPTTSQEEKNILKGILKFGNITVKQIMRTRLDVSGIEYDSTYEQVTKQVADLHYSRLPVYKGNLDNIVGVIHTKDLLPHLGKKGFDWHEVMRQPFFVHGHKLIEDLLTEFQTRRMHFAVVVDEFGGTSGIVTLEDIMEEVIGDIKDEFDEEEFNYSKVDNFTYVFEGKTMLNDVCRIMNVPPDTFEHVKGESDSIGGLILELAGKFPEENSVINYGNFDFTVLEVSKMRIQKVQVTIRQDEGIAAG